MRTAHEVRNRRLVKLFARKSPPQPYKQTIIAVAQDVRGTYWCMMRASDWEPRCLCVMCHKKIYQPSALWISRFGETVHVACAATTTQNCPV